MEDIRSIMPPASVNCVVYHFPCTDGFAAAYVAYLARNKDCEFIGKNHGESLPDVKGKRVLVVDFSWDRETIQRLHAAAECLVVLDHHKTAQSALEGLPYCFFDMYRSGVILAWDYFFPTYEPPMFLRYIQERDLYRFALPDSKEFTDAFMSEVPFSFDAYDRFRTNPELVTIFVTKGQAIGAFKQSMITTICTYSVDRRLNIPLAGLAADTPTRSPAKAPHKPKQKLQGHVGPSFQTRTTSNSSHKQPKKAVRAPHQSVIKCRSYRVKVVNGTQFVSEVGNVLATQEGVDLALIWHYNHKASMYKVSMRSVNDQVADVGAIARYFGGGGHALSAGFQTRQHIEGLFEPQERK